MQKKNQKGFSLVELLIVVAIIGIIAAIAIPSLLAARRAANESAAIGSLRSLGSAQATWISGHNSSAVWADLTGGRLVDNEWIEGATRNNYVFNQVRGGTPDGVFEYSAQPVNGNQGTRAFNIIDDQVVRFATGTVAPTNTSGSAIGVATP